LDYELSEARRRPFVIAMPAMQAWMSKLAADDAKAACRAPTAHGRSLFSILGPIVMTQVFGAFEHKLPGRVILRGRPSYPSWPLRIAMRAMRAATRVRLNCQHAASLRVPAAIAWAMARVPCT
jgi:hypothetical protein